MSREGIKLCVKKGRLRGGTACLVSGTPFAGFVEKASFKHKNKQNQNKS
jgi:hypothetical protein